jgi:hypothetical protein
VSSWPPITRSKRSRSSLGCLVHLSAILISFLLSLWSVKSIPNLVYLPLTGTQTSIALYSALRSRLPTNKSLGFPAEWLILVAPLLLAITLFAYSPGLLSLILLFPTALLMLIPRRELGTPLPSNIASSNRGSNPEVQATKSSIPQLPALTTYRSHMLLMTTLSILAVDFPVFPRSLAKCETYGVSLVRDSWFATILILIGPDGPRCWVFRVFSRRRLSHTHTKEPGLPVRSFQTKDHHCLAQVVTRSGFGSAPCPFCEGIRISCTLLSKRDDNMAHRRF